MSVAAVVCRSLLLLIAVFCCAAAEACVYCDALGCNVCPASKEASAGSDEEVDVPGLSRFRLQGGQMPQPGGDGTPITVTYSYNNFLDGGLKDPDGVPVPADYLRLVTEEAFGLWASVAPINFVEVPDVGTLPYRANSSTIYPLTRGGSTTAPVSYSTFSSDSFGTIRLSHSFINGTDAENGMPTTKALAFFPSNGGNIAGDIHFDNGDPWAVVGTPSEPDVLGILTHEIGHTLGIGHSQFDGAVMFPAALRRNGPGTGLLTDDDIAAVRAIYGAGVGSVTPLTLVPEPAAVLALGLAIACLSPARRRG